MEGQVSEEHYTNGSMVYLGPGTKVNTDKGSVVLEKGGYLVCKDTGSVEPGKVSSVTPGSTVDAPGRRIPNVRSVEIPITPQAMDETEKAVHETRRFLIKIDNVLADIGHTDIEPRLHELMRLDSDFKYLSKHGSCAYMKDLGDITSAGIEMLSQVNWVMQRPGDLSNRKERVINIMIKRKIDLKTAIEELLKKMA
jgi:hypothetical protein